MPKRTIFFLLSIIFCQTIGAQKIAKKFSHADSLRGSLGSARTWWNVLRYDLNFTPNITKETITGKNNIVYKVITEKSYPYLQIDLQAPLVIDSIVLNKKLLPFTKDGNAWLVKVPAQLKGSIHTLSVFYGGKVHQAVKPPWDGGFIFSKDSLGRPWVTVACQGLGASVWYPCKEHQSDEPDLGASLTMTIPDTLTGIANGELQYKKNNGDGTCTYQYAVKNPINNYCIVPYIGKYTSFSENYFGGKGKLKLSYATIDYNINKAKNHFPPDVHRMLQAFEFWFGPYPFYKDGFKLVESPFLGMEHQSAIAYGNKYQNGYLGNDLSATGWGLLFDFIIIHESGHEWFGNSITAADIADMWIQEGFTNYSETLFLEYHYGKKKANAYVVGCRKKILNDKPIIGAYNVNDEGSGDMYYKASNMLHNIRHSINNDALFRNILRGISNKFYHQEVSTADIENYISKKAGFNFEKVFTQYLRTIQIPVFEYYFSKDSTIVFYRYRHCVSGFNLPISLQNSNASIKLYPNEQWQKRRISAAQISLLSSENIIENYYLDVVQAGSQ